MLYSLVAVVALYVFGMAVRWARLQRWSGATTNGNRGRATVRRTDVRAATCPPSFSGRRGPLIGPNGRVLPPRPNILMMGAMQGNPVTLGSTSGSSNNNNIGGGSSSSGNNNGVGNGTSNNNNNNGPTNVASTSNNNNNNGNTASTAPQGIFDTVANYFDRIAGRSRSYSVHEMNVMNEDDETSEYDRFFSV